MKVFIYALLWVLGSGIALAQTQQETTTTLEMSHKHEVITTAPTGTDLNVTGAYVQPVIPGQKNTAAYMTINNPTNEKFVLVGAYSSVAKEVLLHTSITENGVVKMRDAGNLTLLPGEKLVLQPGDLHLMLMNVNTELSKDMNVQICLKFQDSEEMCIQAPVVDKRSHNQHAH